MSSEQRVIKRKVVMTGLPKILNPRGVEMLCQAVLASGIKDRDEDFIKNGQAVSFYIENGFKNFPYSLSKYHLLYSSYKKEKQRNQFSEGKIPLNEFKELACTTSTKELAERYGKNYRCNKSLLFKAWNYKKKENLIMRITAEQAAQALNISLSTITNYVKILKIKKETINGRVSIALAPDDFLSIAKRIDSIHRTTEKQKLVKKYLSGKKTEKQVFYLCNKSIR